MQVLDVTANQLHHRLAREQRDGRLPSVVAALVRTGATAWTGGRGRVAERSDGGGGQAEPTADTQYRIGSISKVFTAVLVLQLRDAGRLSLGDRLEEHVPGTPLGDRTIRQLLSHASGLQAEPDGQWWERVPGLPFPQLAASIGEGALRHPADRRFHYSNLGYGLLGEVVARTAGVPWEQVLRTAVLEPLGLRRTSYLPAAPHAHGFSVHPWAEQLVPEPAHDAGAMAPAGQLWSTVADLARFAAFVAGDTGDVLHPDTLAEMVHPVTVEEGPDGTEPFLDGYGLGLQVRRRGDRVLVGHGGSMPGFVAGLFVDRAAGTGAVCLSNATRGSDPFGLCADLLDTLDRCEPAPPAEWRPVPPPPAAAELLGPWYWGASPFVLRHDGTDLRLEPLNGRGRSSRLVPTATDVWTGSDGYFSGETLRVHRAGDGSITHLDLATFVFTRTPYDPRAPIPGGVPQP